MPKHGIMIAELSPIALADGPSRVRTAHEAIEELCSLGLTKEASLGVLKVLMRAGTPVPATELSGW